MAVGPGVGRGRTGRALDFIGGLADLKDWPVPPDLEPTVVILRAGSGLERRGEEVDPEAGIASAVRADAYALEGLAADDEVGSACRQRLVAGRGDVGRAGRQCPVRAAGLRAALDLVGKCVGGVRARGLLPGERGGDVVALKIARGVQVRGCAPLVRAGGGRVHVLPDAAETVHRGDRDDVGLSVAHVLDHGRDAVAGVRGRRGHVLDARPGRAAVGADVDRVVRDRRAAVAGAQGQVADAPRDVDLAGGRARGCEVGDEIGVLDAAGGGGALPGSGDVVLDGPDGDGDLAGGVVGGVDDLVRGAGDVRGDVGPADAAVPTLAHVVAVGIGYRRPLGVDEALSAVGVDAGRLGGQAGEGDLGAGLVLAEAGLDAYDDALVGGLVAGEGDVNVAAGGVAGERLDVGPCGAFVLAEGDHPARDRRAAVAGVRGDIALGPTDGQRVASAAGAQVGDLEGERDGVDFVGVAPSAGTFGVDRAHAHDVPEVVGDADRAVGVGEPRGCAADVARAALPPVASVAELDIVAGGARDRAPLGVDEAFPSEPR